MENYICINGKKAELTEEQLKALGIELPKPSPFERQTARKPFYFITNKGNVEYGVEAKDFHCEGLYKAANYCTDKTLLEQRALHETLNRLLWRYSMEHDGDKIEWEDPDNKWSIAYDECYNDVKVYSFTYYHYIGAVYFNTQEIAEAAIKEIVEPFMAAHPDFKW